MNIGNSLTAWKASPSAAVLLLSRVLTGMVIHTLRWLQGSVEKAVGKRISELRQQQGITQDDFAILSGLNRAHLYRVETGNQSATLRTLKAVADALGVRIRDLLGDV